MRHVLGLALVVEQPLGLALGRERERAHELGLAHASERRLLLVDDELVLGCASSTYQSTSTTPAVRSIRSRTWRAISI